MKGARRELEGKSESQRKEVRRMFYPTMTKDIVKGENEVAAWSFWKQQLHACLRIFNFNVYHLHL